MLASVIAASCATQGPAPLVPKEWSFVEAPPRGPADKVDPPALLTRIAPEYPFSARRRHVTGCVVCRAAVAADGRVENVDVVKPVDHDLDADAVRTVRQWRYAPGRLNGAARRCLVTVDVCYSLQ